MPWLPVNPRFLTSLRQVDITGFVSAASGLAVVIFAAHRLGLRPSALQIGCFAGGYIGDKDVRIFSGGMRLGIDDPLPIF